MRRGAPALAAVLAIALAVAAAGSASSGAPAARPVDVYPIAGTTTANPATQISFRGATSLPGLAVSGSQTGAHSGRTVVHPDGRGFSFLPDHRFAHGETVTVRSTGRLTGAGSDGTVRFGILNPPPDGHIFDHPTGDPGGNPPGVQSFLSRRDLRPPNLTITKRLPGASKDDLFLGVKGGPGQDGPMIRDYLGRLIWFRPVPAPRSPYDFRAQTYHGKPVLTWWEGRLYSGKGRGYGLILDSSYRLVKRVNAGNGYQMDQHEFKITPQGTALITAYEPVRYDLSSLGGPAAGTAWDSIVQEVDIRTGLVLFEWHSLAHVSIKLSTFPERGSHAFDPFHVNSIQVEGKNRIMLSARNTDALFEIDRHTGHVVWRIGGKASSYKMGPGTGMRGQHQAVRQPDGTITVFDNGGSTRFPNKPDREARGIRLRVNDQTRSVSLVHQWHHPGKRLFTRSQGSVQVLGNGDTLLSWGGGQPYVTEFAPDGHSDFEAHFDPLNGETYRAYRLRWTGARPASRPAVAAFQGGSGLDVYVSWNGATDVAAWELLAGASPSLLVPVKATSWADFETRIDLPGVAPSYVAVRGLDALGATLGTSPTVQPQG